MSSDSIISIQRIAKHFGEVRAVDDVDMEIARGEFFSLLGPSGCGKTTLLRMLAGFEAPTSGEIYIDGQPMSATPPNHRPVNMVFQNYAIFPHLNVHHNIAFGLRKDRLSKAEVNRKVDEALEMIALPGYGKRGASELSGGQRQRIALARALVKKPKVLLLDEPLGALDKKLREQMQLELRQLQKSVGITFVFVTHDQEEALTMSDRIAVMSDGKALETDSPARLYESPKTRFVADFLGTMNFFQGEIRGRENGTTFVDSRQLGSVQTSVAAEGLGDGAPVLVAIRPENLRISFENPGQDQNMVEGALSHSAFLGDRAHLYVHLPGAAEPISVAMQNLDGAASRLGGDNQPVWISWSDSAVVLLPTA